MNVGALVSAKPPFEAMRAEVAALVDCGVDTLWWSDHLMAFAVPGLWSTERQPRRVSDLHIYVDPFVAIAACASAARSALLGVAVTDAVRRMPATLLQSAMTLDHIVPGKVVLGLGSGERLNYVPYGWEIASPTKRLAEAAQEIRSFITDPGPTTTGAVLGLRPPAGSPGPALWIAAHGPRGYETVGRYADGWLPFYLDAAEWLAGRDEIRAAAVEAGRNPDSIVMGMTFLVVLQDDHRTAHELLRHPAIGAKVLHLPNERFQPYGRLNPLGGGSVKTVIATLMAEEVAEAAKLVPFELVHEMIPHGTAGEVSHDIAEYRGLGHARVHELSPSAGGATVTRSRERLAELIRCLKQEPS